MTKGVSIPSNILIAKKYPKLFRGDCTAMVRAIKTKECVRFTLKSCKKKKKMYVKDAMGMLLVMKAIIHANIQAKLKIEVINTT